MAKSSLCSALGAKHALNKRVERREIDADATFRRTGMRRAA